MSGEAKISFEVTITGTCFVNFNNTGTSSAHEQFTFSKPTTTPTSSFQKITYPCIASNSSVPQVSPSTALSNTTTTQTRFSTAPSETNASLLFRRPTATPAFCSTVQPTDTFQRSTNNNGFDAGIATGNSAGNRFATQSVIVSATPTFGPHGITSFQSSGLSSTSNGGGFLFKKGFEDLNTKTSTAAPSTIWKNSAQTTRFVMPFSHTDSNIGVACPTKTGEIVFGPKDNKTKGLGQLTTDSLFGPKGNKTKVLGQITADSNINNLHGPAVIRLQQQKSLIKPACLEIVKPTTTQPQVVGFLQPQQNTSMPGTGADQPQANSFSLFGPPATTSAFASPLQQPLWKIGQTAKQISASLFGQPANCGTSITKYQPTIDIDDPNTQHQCITAMIEYENKSLEELRMEDFWANRKGPQKKAVHFFDNLFGKRIANTTENNRFQSAYTFGQHATGGFKAAATGTSNPFTSKKSAFGESAVSPIFPHTSATSTAPAFDQTHAGLSTSFVTNSGQLQQQPSLFGQPAGDANNTVVRTNNTGLIAYLPLFLDYFDNPFRSIMKCF